jgi:hypothetical protein
LYLFKSLFFFSKVGNFVDWISSALLVGAGGWEGKRVGYIVVDSSFDIEDLDFVNGLVATRENPRLAHVSVKLSILPIAIDFLLDQCDTIDNSCDHHGRPVFLCAGHPVDFDGH